MSTTTSKGRLAIVGAGPGGMATALAAHRAGFDVKLYERYGEIKAAGNILNLWPPPQKVLGLIGVDTHDLGAPANATFRRNDGRVRVTVRLPEAVVAEYGGGFIGLLRWGLYKRMIDALPPGVLQLGHEVTALDDRGDRVSLTFADRPPAEADVVVGADGLNSFVRRALWGEQPIRHQRLHLVGRLPVPRRSPAQRHGDHARPHHAGQLLRDPPRGQVGLRVVGARGVRSERAVRGGRARVRAGARPPLRRPTARPGRADSARAPAALGDPRSQAAQAVVQGPRDARRRCRSPHLPVRRLRRRHVDRGRLLPRLRARADRRPRQRRRQDRAAGVRGAAQAAHQAGDRAGVLYRLRLPPAAAPAATAAGPRL